MSSRNSLQDIAVASIFGILAVLVAGYLSYTGNFSGERVIGFLSGLIGGFLSVLAGRIRFINPSKIGSPLRVVEIALSPLAFILLLPFSQSLGGGYFLGSASTFCFAWALLGLKSSGPSGRSE